MNFNQGQNRDYLFELINTAVLICKAWGKVTHISSRYYYDSNLEIWQCDIKNYIYTDKKISIEAAEGHHKDNDAKIILLPVTATVFKASINYSDIYHKLPDSPSLSLHLFTYRTGQWEKYLLSKKAEAQRILTQKERDYQKELKSRQLMKFEPIDDADFFNH